HSQLKTGHPVRSAIHKQLNGRLVLRWVTTWESLLLYVLLFESTSFSIQFYAAQIWLKSPILHRDARERALAAEKFRSTVDATALQEALLAAQYAATEVLQQQSQFSVAALPQELEALVPEVLSTLGLLASLETYASYTIRPERAIVYAYELGTCEAANLPEGCDPDDINGEALWLDFDAGLLNLRLLSFEESGGDIFAGSIFSGLERVDHLETIDERIISAIQKHFSDFLDQNTVLKDFLGRRGPKFKPLRSDIKAIVTTGDPPPGSMEAIRLAIHHISPGLANLIRDSVDPSSAMAVGAARRAREMWDHPEQYYPHCRYFIEDPSHDEL
ncbi:hypothetical protein KCU99_g4954, partial [Aureobasidium melanogenum]